MDRMSPEMRSELMSKIRSTGTNPEAALERIVQSALPRRKIELHSKSLPGRPDVFIPSLKLAIFAQGCFWHSCPKHGRRPGTHTDYWWPKLQANELRDARNQSKLRRSGLGVWVVWEHDLRSNRIVATSARITKRLHNRVALMRVEN